MLRVCAKSEERTTRPITSVEAAVALLPARNDARDSAPRKIFDDNATEMKVILRSWIKGGYAESVPQLGGLARKLHSKRFDDGRQLLRALVGELESRFNLSTEKSLAIEAKNNGYIEQNLAEALQAVYLRAATLNDTGKSATILRELKGFRGSYGKYYTMTRTGWLDLTAYIAKPDPTCVTTNITIFHDLMEFFITRYDFVYDDATDVTTRTAKSHQPKLTSGSEMISDDPQYLLGTVEYLAEDGEAPAYRQSRAPIDEDNYRNNLATPNESDLMTQAARRHKIPMWASHSYTTLRMLQLVQWANYGDKNLRAWFHRELESGTFKGMTPAEVRSYTKAHQQEISAVGMENVPQYEAVAWSIFAFWNRTLLQGIHPIHRFHEVMDIALSFGVPYAPFQYPPHPPHHDPQRPYSHWYSWLAS